MLTDKHIIYFLEKGKKFFEENISYSNCDMGTPSVVKITNPTTSTHVCYSLTQSSERYYLSSLITKMLEDHLFLSKEDGKQIAEYIIQKKYEQYIDFVMSS